MVRSVFGPLGRRIPGVVIAAVFAATLTAPAAPVAHAQATSKSKVKQAASKPVAKVAPRAQKIQAAKSAPSSTVPRKSERCASLVLDAQSGQVLHDASAYETRHPACDFSRLARAVLARAGLLSGLVCVLLDWDPPRQDFVRRLRALQVPLEVLVVADAARPAPDPGPMADLPERFHLLDPRRLGEQLAAL